MMIQRPVRPMLPLLCAFGLRVRSLMGVRWATQRGIA